MYEHMYEHIVILIIGSLAAADVVVARPCEVFAWVASRARAQGNSAPWRIVTRRFPRSTEGSGRCALML